jgi:HlyD family secretion protein
LSQSIKHSNFGRLKKILPWFIGLASMGVIGVITTVLFSHTPTRDVDIDAQTITVESKDWVMKIQASGVVQPIRKINLSPEDSGKIASLYVREGDFVRKGQVIARMNSDKLEAQVNQYKAILAKATADLEQKRSGNRPEEIAQANARLVKMQADLQQLQNTTPQEINQAQAQLDATVAKTELALIQFNRNQKLKQEGAVSQDKLDEAATNYKTALATQQEAQTKLLQLRNSKKQEFTQRQAAVEEAFQSLRQQKNGVRPKEITQAEAEVKQATAQLAYYQTQLNNTVIQAPFAGIITRRFAQEGDFVTPTTAASTSEGATSTSIVELSSGLEIEAKIPEANISKIQLGQKVDIKTDTYSETFQGKVSLVAPRAVQENNITSFRVKIALITGQSKLKSGMNVRLALQSQPIKNALVIPLASVVTQSNGETGVYIPDTKNQSRFQAIKISSASGEQVRVLTGLKSGDKIFIAPPENQIIPGVDTVNVEY